MNPPGVETGGLEGEHLCRSQKATDTLAARLGAALRAGDWVLLHGALGAGKTAFVRGMARGMGIDYRRVHSPTFTLVSEYPGPLALAHVDLYRIEESLELEELGLEDLRERRVVVAVEWAERLPRGIAPPGAWRVRLEPAGEGRRRVRIAR